MKVLNFGSLNLDYVYQVNSILIPGETQASTDRKIFCGGKGLNQSIALAKAGVTVYHAGMIGEGGEILLETCRENNVNTKFIRQISGPSGHTVIQVDKNGQNCILLYGGANRSITREFANEVLEHFEKGDILLLQNEINELDYIIERANAVAGLVFYGSAVLCIGLFVSGHAVPGGAVLAIMFGVPLLLIFFKEPLTNLVKKKAEVMPKEKGMFIVQGIFELFEVILSYFSNTLSFVRIGAFAVSHAAMMEVVLMLAGAENGSPNWIVIILGNLFVCAMEGLIVGIQVLRLEYYEMFSRFYKGSGRKFEPFCSKNK